MVNLCSDVGTTVVARHLFLDFHTGDDILIEIEQDDLLLPVGDLQFL